MSNFTYEDLEDLLYRGLGLSIQKPKPAIIAIESDGTNPAAEEWTVPVQISGQAEKYFARYNPIGLDAEALAYPSPVDLKLNEEGEYEIVGLNAIFGRQAYNGITPTPNFSWKQHTHEDEIGGGQLNASLVFDDGTVPVARGGTDIASYAVGDIIYASGATTLSKLAGVATGNALISGGVTTAPAWGKIGLTTHVSGTLPVGNGGTGAATLTANNVILGNGTSAVQFVAPGTSGNVLTSNGTTWTSAAPSGGSPWTTTSNVIHPGVLTDAVAIGSTSNATAKLYILEDDPDEIPLRIKAAAAQTLPVLYIENDSGDVFFNLSANGQVSVNPAGLSGGAFIANGTSGATLLFADASANITYIGGALVFNEPGDDADARFEGDNDANLLFLNAGTNRVGIGDDTPDGRFAVVGRADEVQTIIRGNGTQTSNTLEIQNSAATVVASVSNAGLISGVQLGLTSGVASTTTPNILIRDTAQNFGHAKGSGSTGLYTSLDGMYSARITDTTVTTKTGPGTLIATITVPADFWRAQRQIRFKFSGRGEAANVDNLLRLVVQDGSTDLIDTRTAVANTTGNVRDISGEVLITCRTTGTTGSVWVSARVFSSLFTDGGGGRDPNTAADTINTTTSRTFNVRLYWSGTGAPTITVSDDYFDIAG